MTRPAQLDPSRGATYSEVLVALALTLIGLMGAMGAFHAAGRSIGQGELATRALAMAESRIEAKRSVRWEQLLMDDLDHDGVPEILMRDDGVSGDRAAGDGIYSAAREQDGIRLAWTVAPNRAGSLPDSGYAVLEVSASYMTSSGEHEVRLATVRANPRFAGAH
ncbi:MAG TPA: choice-of-anchor X domain-containing protein [Nitrospira sp.]|nr:choice-of-anchor X domain-containing protein [Nitrospira sp.]